MLRAMDSAVSGLRAHQNKLDVIGNNIANVNTFGFKAQNYTFKEAMYQTTSTSTGGSGTKGGINGVQYGYGSMTGSVTVDMGPTSATQLGGFNACLEGTGFFITSPSNGSITNNSDTMKSSSLYYTRVGQFKPDNNGFIVDATGSGNFIMGFRIGTDGNPDISQMVPLRAPTDVTVDTTTGVVTPTFSDTGDALVMNSISINALGEITAQVTYTETPGGEPQKATVTLGKVAVANFQNPEGLTKAGGNNYVSSPSDNSGDVIASHPGSGATSNLMVGYLENSNVDLSKEFAEMIMAQRGFQANSKLITVSDEILAELINMKR